MIVTEQPRPEIVQAVCLAWREVMAACGVPGGGSCPDPRRSWRGARVGLGPANMGVSSYFLPELRLIADGQAGVSGCRRFGCGICSAVISPGRMGAPIPGVWLVASGMVTGSRVSSLE